MTKAQIQKVLQDAGEALSVYRGPVRGFSNGVSVEVTGHMPPKFLLMRHRPMPQIPAGTVTFEHANEQAEWVKRVVRVVEAAGLTAEVQGGLYVYASPVTDEKN